MLLSVSRFPILIEDLTELGSQNVRKVRAVVNGSVKSMHVLYFVAYAAEKVERAI